MKLTPIHAFTPSYQHNASMEPIRWKNVIIMKQLLNKEKTEENKTKEEKSDIN